MGGGDRGARAVSGEAARSTRAASLRGLGQVLYKRRDYDAAQAQLRELAPNRTVSCHRAEELALQGVSAG